tara:strand:+ start:16530 stop:17027 length:498 start_codon:yes stop_codon:yes gene_type:complete
MKKVARFTSQTSAHLAKEALLSHGINSEIIGSKEYSSIIVGGDHGRYDLMVDWKDETEAARLIKGFDISLVDNDAESAPQATPSALLRKAIVMGLLAAVFIPIIFNYASLKNLAQYLKIETNSSKRMIATIVVVALQFLTVVVLYYTYKAFTTDIRIDYLNQIGE